MDTTKTKNWPEANEKGLGWTAKYPRPTEEGGHHPSVVATRQAEWDAAEALRVKVVARNDEIRARRETEEQEKRDAATARAQEQAAKKLDAVTAQLRRGYMAAPGATEEAFQAALPELLETARRESAVSGEDKARQSQAGLYRSF